MSSLAIQKRPRRILTKLHRWSGLLLLVFLLIAGFTGSILAFRWDVERLINPHVFRVEPTSTPRPYAELIANAERHHPDAFVSGIRVPEQPDHALLLTLKNREDQHRMSKHIPGAKSSVAFNQVIINPYTGAILAARNTTEFHLDRLHLVPVLHRLHYCLFMDQYGLWFMGGCAILWFVTNLIGLALTWPRHGSTAESWKPLFSIRWQGGNYKINYDLHRCLSLLTLPVLAVVAFTSVYLNLPDVVKPVVSYFSPLSSPMPKLAGHHHAVPHSEVIPVEDVLALSAATFPAGRTVMVNQEFSRGLYSVRIKQPDDISAMGNHTLYVRMDSGEIAGMKLPADNSAGDTFITWMHPLHDGRAFGLTGQIIICLSALTLCAICITGLNVWWRKHRSNHKRRG